MKVEAGNNVWDFLVPVYPNRKIGGKNFHSNFGGSCEWAFQAIEFRILKWTIF